MIGRVHFITCYAYLAERYFKLLNKDVRHLQLLFTWLAKNFLAKCTGVVDRAHVVLIFVT